MELVHNVAPIPFVSNGKNVMQCTVDHRGDLLYKSYLEITLPRVEGRNVRWCANVGFALIEKLALQIGYNVVDVQSGEFMYIWNALNLTRDEATNLHDMVNADSCKAGQKVYVPLSFTFCDDLDNALPLVCLAFHKVKFALHMRALEDLLQGEVDSIQDGFDVKLLCGHVSMGCVERHAFVTDTPYEYLIKQTQTNVFERWTGEHALTLYNECAELFIVCKSHTSAGAFDFTDTAGHNPVSRAVLKLDGVPTVLDGRYMNTVIPFQYHTGRAPPGVNVVVWCMHPEQHQPSGSFNMSHVQEASLQLDLPSDEEWRVVVYARSHTTMTVSSGMAKFPEWCFVKY